MDNEQINTDDESSDDEQKKTKINSPIKNLLQPIPIDEHSKKSIQPSPIKLDQLKSDEELLLPSKTPVIKKHVTKREISVQKSNGTIPTIMNNSIPLFLTSK